MRKINFLLLSLFVIFALAAAFSANASSDVSTSVKANETLGDWEYILNPGGHATIVKYLGSQRNVIIPDELNGHRVIAIGDSCFNARPELESVLIPETIEAIGKNAFKNCSSLAEITIPKAVTKISDYAFDECTNIERITIDSEATSVGAYGSFNNVGKYTPNGVTVTFTDSVKIIGQRFFQNNPFIRTVSLGNSIKEIAAYAFRGCSGMTTINFPECLEVISTEAFKNCSSLTEILLPEKLTKIDNYAFSECTGIESIIISSKNAALGAYPIFTNAGKYAENGVSATFTDKVKNISNKFFNACGYITEVHIESADCTIGDSANTLGSSEITVIYGYSASTAQHYAAKYNYKFISIGGILGDINNDSVVNTSDAVYILKYAAELLELTDEQIKSADVNHDNSINTSDAVYILKYSAGIITGF